jgi:hypothetical protein
MERQLGREDAFGTPETPRERLGVYNKGFLENGEKAQRPNWVDLDVAKDCT